MPRLASLTLAPLGCLLFLGLGPRASAGDLFHKCASDCNAQIIQLPAQQVVVETTQPRVIVQETKFDKHARVRAEAVAVPFVATFYTPVLPLATTAPAPAPAADSTSLSLAHQMEANMLQLERARAANEAELAATQRVFERISRSMQAGGAGRADTAAAAQLQELNTRLERLERLVLLHSDVLKQLTQPVKPMTKVDGEK